MSDARLRAVAFGLALVGAVSSGYLTWVHYAEVEPLCTGMSNCVRVQSSEYAELAGVLVALTSALVMAALAGVTIARVLPAPETAAAAT
jgi:hypothetical protein